MKDAWDKYKETHEFMPCEKWGQCDCEPWPDKRCLERPHMKELFDRNSNSWK